MEIQEREKEEEKIAHKKLNLSAKTDAKVSKNSEKIIWYGRPPARPVGIALSASSDPKIMMKGMEEYFFKDTQAMNFGS